MTPPLDFDEALERLLALVPSPAPESVPVSEAHGRILAEALAAARAQPAMDLSAMDGFAIAGPGPWTIVGEARAGHPYPGEIALDHAVRISTGAIVPGGADRILIQENAQLSGTSLTATADLPEAGRHIRRAEFDFAVGDTLLQVGSQIEAPQIALALMAGYQSLKVGRRPRVAILESGDELRAAGVACEASQIPASNGAMVRAMVLPFARQVDLVGPVPDSPDLLAKALRDAGDADIIVTTGGASVGPHDLIRPALAEAGFDIDFWRVAIRPGKPLIVARSGSRLALGLPGNPVSAFVTATLFLTPILRRWAGAREVAPRRVRLPLAAAIPANGPRRHFIRGHIRENHVQAIEQQDSSALLSLASANTLIDRPANAPAAKVGEMVDCVLLQNGWIA